MRHLRTLGQIYLSFLFLFAVGCNSGTADGTVGTTEEMDEQQVPEGTPMRGLELDNGKRWVVSPPMLVPIKRMQERIAHAEGGGGEITLDHAVLADSLFVDIDELVVGCTMQGKAHEELHDWLMPHMQLVQDLEKATDPGEARSIIRKLSRSSEEFDHYFE